jgi:putative mRNA 3-end processing factor
MDLSKFLTLAPEGLYCPSGDFFVDPTRPVPRALITHGHSDHARSGHGFVLATPETLAIMAVRYGADFCGTRQAIGTGEIIQLGDAAVSFHPAGHVLGSAQIRLGFPDLTVVVSGDYKRESDPTCAGFEVVPCDVFVTEATFGLPVFRHSRTDLEVAKLLASRALFPERAHLVGAYALGKAQRLIMLLREAGYGETIYVHGAMVALNGLYESFGLKLGPLAPATTDKRDRLEGKIVIAPPSAVADKWSRRFADPIPAFASGWMRVRARARQRHVELPLILSDHGDWDELTDTISELRPQELWVTHGSEEALLRWAGNAGITARALELVGYEDEEGA